MDKWLLNLWQTLFLLKVTHSRFDGDVESQWLQWGDVEQVINDLINEYKSKVTGRIRLRCQSKHVQQEQLDKVFGDLNLASQKRWQQQRLINQLKERLQQSDTALLYADPPNPDMGPLCHDDVELTDLIK